MTNTDFDTHLRQQLEQLPKAKMPERDLWSGIELALADEPAPETLAKQPQRAKLAPVTWLSSAAAVAIISLFGFLGVQQYALDSAANSANIAAALSEQHQAQKDALLIKFKDQPALTQNWQEQLQELDEAAMAIKKALKEDQNNMALLKMLQNVHQQQIDLIERVHSPKFLQI